MTKITNSLDLELLIFVRRYAQEHQMSVNALICKLLEQTVRFQPEDWFEECFSLMDRAGGCSEGRKWSRK